MRDLPGRGRVDRACLRARVGTVLLSVTAIHAGSGGVLTRDTDPLLLTGADLPSLTGIAPDELVAFRHDGAWQQIPVQVDERDFVDWGVIYNTTPLGIGEVVYSDSKTFTGADSNPQLDLDDEIVVMSRDAGGPAPLFDEPPGTIADSGVELRVRDPVDSATGFVYFFRQDGTLDPAAGQSYVDYQFNLLSGDYMTTYNLNSGPNPEDSTFLSPYYGHHFSDRWIDDELQIFADGATGADILDRHKDQFAPGNCARTEDTFSAGEGAFVVNRSGAVRALRSYLGANSGPLTQREHLFYERRQDLRTFLRVHAIAGVVDYFDYSPAASGMAYRNDLDSVGFTIDGSTDAATPGELRWEMVDGAQGSLIVVHELDTDITELAVTSYYEDDTTPSVTQCTGDAFAYGSSGPWITSSIPCTDPALCGVTSSRLELRRILYYGPPGATAADAAALAARREQPLELAGAAWVGSPGEAAALLLAPSAAEPGKLDLSWDAACSTTAEGYAVFEGTLGDFTSHAAVDCDVTGTGYTVDPLAGDRYYLVVPVSPPLGFEGSYGRSSDGAERPAGVTACWIHVPHACP